MMCTEAICLTDGAIRTVYEDGAVRIQIGYIDGRPFSALVIDTRDGAHLHFPVWDLEGALKVGLRSLI